MLEIVLSDVDVQLRISNEGVRTLAFIDPRSGVCVRLSFQEDAAAQLAAGLMPSTSGLVTATEMPREVKH